MDLIQALIVMKMQDEASPKMENLAKKTAITKKQFQDFKLTVMAIGSAMTSLGSLMGRMDSPLAKMGSNFLLTAGAILSTVSAIAYAIPAIKTLITWLRSLAVVQAITQALSGPAGWATLGIGLGVAAAGAAAVYGMSGGFSGRSSGKTTVNINSQAFAGSPAEARKFGGQVNDTIKRESRIGR